MMTPTLLLMVLGCTPDPLPVVEDTAGVPYYPPSELGPYAPGMITLEVTDPRGKDLIIEVWYPALVGESAEPDDYEGLLQSTQAYRNALPLIEEGPFPIVAFSHGFGGIRYQSAFLTEHLASHGMIVISPDHVHNTFIDMNDEYVVDVLLERPDDVRYAVDAVLALSDSDDPILGGMADISGGYAMVGHSFGAYTAMVIGGGQLDPKYAETYCASNGGRVCRYLDRFDPALLEGHGTVDDRAIATVPMSPGLWYLFGEGGAGLADVRQPLLLGGDRDQILDYDDEARPTYAAMTAPRHLATYVDGGHYAPFSNSCDFPAPITESYFDDCDGPEDGWIDIASSQQATRTIVTAYLMGILHGDERYQDAWSPDTFSVTYPNVILEYSEDRPRLGSAM